MTVVFIIITIPCGTRRGIAHAPGLFPNWKCSVGKRLSLGSRHDLANELSQSSLPILCPNVAM